MSSNTRYAGPSEPSKAKVVSQSIDTDEMSRHQLIEHVQLNKVKFIKQIVGVCHSSVLRNGAIKRKNGGELTNLMKGCGEDIKESFCY